jgi:O-antigen ligase
VVAQPPLQHDKSRSREADQAGEASDFDDPAARLARLGERLRRVSLGLLAALVTARAYWPSEIDPDKASGSGLYWVLAIIMVSGLGVAAPLIGGRFRCRWSWTDAAVVVLMFLVGLSSVQGQERRLAINMAWEWAGLGFAYILARNLPRGRGESTVLAGALVATAVAVSAYGLFQARVELPRLQERFRRNPQQVLKEANVPDDPQQVRAFTDRLIGSNELFATFGLANSLAGFLVGPLVLGTGMVLVTLGNRKAGGSSYAAIGLAAVPLLCTLTCLILTKSRSAWIGLAVGLVVLGWQARRAVPTRVLVRAGLAGLTILFVLAAAALAAGRLDREVLTQSTHSLRLRWDYWRGTWGVITEGAQTPVQALSARTFWSGIGPGNLGPHYLLYKLPWASEEIQDPHNLFLEVWATAGFWALLALVSALVLAFWNLLGPARHPDAEARESGKRSGRGPEVGSREHTLSAAARDPDPAPGRLGWLALSGGMGLVAVLVVGQFNLFQRDLLVRWLVLAAGWMIAALLGRRLWTGVELPASACGAAALAIVINLLAAGGIGFSSVALCLWLLIALGLNLRADRPCGRLREYESRLPGLGLAMIWAGLAGSFAGAITPFWRCEAALARADEALAHKPPDFARAEAAYEYAKSVDMYNPRPWLSDSYLQYLIWQSRGSKPGDLRWKKRPALLLLAASRPRNRNAWALHSERAKVTRELLNQVGPTLAPREIIPLQASVVEATRTASRLYPTNSMLHARLAEASAEISMFQDAVTEAQEALRLDGLKPPDKKLPDALREVLTSKLPEWREKAAQFKVGEQPAAAK